MAFRAGHEAAMSAFEASVWHGASCREARPTAIVSLCVQPRPDRLRAATTTASSTPVLAPSRLKRQLRRTDSIRWRMTHFAPCLAGRFGFQQDRPVAVQRGPRRRPPPEPGGVGGASSPSAVGATKHSKRRDRADYHTTERPKRHSPPRPARRLLHRALRRTRR